MAVIGKHIVDIPSMADIYSNPTYPDVGVDGQSPNVQYMYPVILVSKSCCGSMAMAGNIVFEVERLSRLPKLELGS